MSTPELTQTLIDKLKQNIYHFVIVNFACPDMVGHTGNIDAAVKACQAADQALAQIVPTVLNLNGTALITADHGNTEEMINLSSGEVDTEHSVNPVPFIAASRVFEGQNRSMPPGILADVAPTILKILNLPVPSAMTGKSLL